MGDINSKEQIKKEINDKQIKDDTTILKKPSILKKTKYRLVSLKSTPNLLNLGAQAYLNSIKYQKQFKKDSSKKVSINIDNNEYFFMDNSKNPKKNNYKSTSELISYAKEKFLDDLLFIDDNENNEKTENNINNENSEIKNNGTQNNGNNKSNKDESEKSSSDLDSNEDNKNEKNENEKEKKEIYENEKTEYKLIFENENFDNKNEKNEKNNNNANNENNNVLNIDNSFFLFDWDDTIHFTSNLLKQKKHLSKEEKSQIKYFEKNIYELFTKILEKGKIFLITNLDIIHIETSIIKYYPSLHSKLNKLEIISGKEKSKLNNKNWKISSFIENQRDEDNDSIKNIICFVDCSIQNDVSDILKNSFNNAFIKIIKFNQNPNFNDLIKQFSLVNQNFNILYNNEKSFVMKIEKN